MCVLYIGSKFSSRLIYQQRNSYILSAKSTVYTCMNYIVATLNCVNSSYVMYTLCIMYKSILMISVIIHCLSR